MRSVAAIPALALVAGAAIGPILPPRSAPFLVLAMAVSLGATAFAWRQSHARGLVAAVSAGVTAGGALLSADAWLSASRTPLGAAFRAIAGDTPDGGPDGAERGAAVVVTGVLRADAAPSPGGVSLSVAVRSLTPFGGAEPLRADGGLLLTVVGEAGPALMSRWRAGRTIRAAAQVRRPTRYLNPGSADAERGLARRGTTLVGTVKSGWLVEITERAGAAEEWAASVRAFVRTAVDRGVGRWSTRSAGIVTAILIGDRSGLEEPVRRGLQEAGTYHVIAISGGNIAILAGLALVCFRVAGVLGRSAMLTTIAALLAYAYVVGEGGGASVSRATAMAVVYFAARAVDLRGPAGNALALAAAAVVALQPLAPADPAFLLTCGATAGILAIAPVVDSARLRRPVRMAAVLLAASLAAEATLMPVGAFYFSRVTLAGPLLNFAAVPLMAGVQMAGLTVVAADLVLPAAAPYLGWLAHAGAEGLVRSADVAGVAPALSWRVAPPAWWPLAGYYASLTAWWGLERRRRDPMGAETPRVRVLRHTACVTWACAALWIAGQPWTMRAARDGRLTVTFIDVGQGDATLVRLPQGASLLVDAGGQPYGGAFDVGDRVVGPVLRWLGVRRLHGVALSHAHPDHAGGMPSILREFRPLTAWDGIPVPPLEPYRTLRAGAAAAGVQWMHVQAGDRVVLDEVEIVVHHPGLPDWERQQVRNDDSLVLELRWRDVSIVFTGDIGRETERVLLSRFDEARLRVLKVPHHGSLTSSSAPFLRALRPCLAVASAGRGNRFGHPAPAVAARYAESGIPLFRTDRDGAVTVTSDGYSLEVETVVSGDETSALTACQTASSSPGVRSGSDRPESATRRSMTE